MAEENKGKRRQKLTEAQREKRRQERKRRVMIRAASIASLLIILVIAIFFVANGIISSSRARAEAKAKKEAEARVSIGDAFALKGNLQALTRTVWAGRPLDDRAGCAVLMELLKEEAEYDITVCFTTREEVGGNGAGNAEHYTTIHNKLISYFFFVYSSIFP